MLKIKKNEKNALEIFSLYKSFVFSDKFSVALRVIKDTTKRKKKFRKFLLIYMSMTSNQKNNNICILLLFDQPLLCMYVNIHKKQKLYIKCKNSSLAILSISQAIWQYCIMAIFRQYGHIAISFYIWPLWVSIKKELRALPLGVAGTTKWRPFTLFFIFYWL